MPDDPRRPEEALAEQLAAVVAPAVQDAGLVCEQVDVRSRGGRRTVTVTVDLPEDETGSADLDTVAEASRRVSELLDTRDDLLGSAPYELEVTTPGAERTLTAPRHFRRARGRLLSVRTTDDRELTARLLDVTADGELVLRPQDLPGTKPRARSARPVEPVHLPLGDVASARVLLDFSAAADTDPTDTPADA